MRKADCGLELNDMDFSSLSMIRLQNVIAKNRDLHRIRCAALLYSAQMKNIMLEQPGHFSIVISRWVKCRKRRWKRRILYVKSMDTNANGTVAAVTDDDYVYPAGERSSWILWKSHPGS